MRNTDAANYIARREPFCNSTGSFYGVGGEGYGTGRLPHHWIRRYRDTHALYTVYSYDTPVAWCSIEDGWVIPDVRYSVTTSRHQTITRQGVASSPAKV